LNAMAKGYEQLRALFNGPEITNLRHELFTRSTPQTGVSSIELGLGLSQMGLNEFDSSPSDLARPGIVVLVIKAVHAERMVHEVQSNVAVDRFRDETIEARFQIWNLIPPCSRDEHR